MSEPTEPTRPPPRVIQVPDWSLDEIADDLARLARLAQGTVLQRQLRVLRDCVRAIAAALAQDAPTRKVRDQAAAELTNFGDVIEKISDANARARAAAGIATTERDLDLDRLVIVIRVIAIWVRDPTDDHFEHVADAADALRAGSGWAAEPTPEQLEAEDRAQREAIARDVDASLAGLFKDDDFKFEL